MGSIANRVIRQVLFFFILIVVRTQRSISFDIVKFCAIFMVVFGHVYTYGVVDDHLTVVFHDFIYSFHMPLFAIVSGYFFHKKSDFMIYFREKSCQLLLPILFWSILTVLYLRVPGDIKEGQFHILTYLRDLLSQILGGYWFLKALWCCCVFHYLVIWRDSHVIVKTLVMLLLLYLLSLSGILPNKFYGESFLFLYPFFGIGFFCKTCKVEIDKTPTYMFFLGLFLFMVAYIFLWQHSFCFYTTNTSFYNDSLQGYNGWMLIYVVLLRLFMGIVGSFLLIFLVKKIVFLVKKTSYEEFVLEPVSIIGRTTLGIYLVQEFVFPMMRRLFIGLSVYVSFSLSILLSVLMCTFGSYIFLHFKYFPFGLLAFGKK